MNVKLLHPERARADEVEVPMACMERPARLKWLQDQVGGFIQVLFLPDRKVMVLNEDGKHLGLPYNQSASVIAFSAGVIDVNDYIAGVALIAPLELLN